VKRGTSRFRREKEDRKEEQKMLGTSQESLTGVMGMKDMGPRDAGRGGEEKNVKSSSCYRA